MISGRYVERFDDATHGMLEGASLNAPYPFFWVRVLRVEKREIVCSAAGKEMRLTFRRTQNRDRASVIITDPIFEPIRFPVLPFKGEEQ